MTETIEAYGAALLFLNVLLEQLGLPIPAMPTLIVAGALAADKRIPFVALAAALPAALLGNVVLYAIGRRYGNRALRLLCGISLSPDSCVRQTSLHFEQWGGWTLLFAKFLPGIGTVAPLLAGVIGFNWIRYLVLCTIGSLLWLAAVVAVGMIFHDQITDVVRWLEQLGGVAGAGVALAVAAYIAFKWWERRRFYNTLRVARITVDELNALVEGKHDPLVVDLRTAVDRQREGTIPGARIADYADIERELADFPRNRDIVFFCSCPNEATAASAAKLLMDLGYTRVRPLAGGFDAWAGAGYKVDLPAASLGDRVSAAR